MILIFYRFFYNLKTKYGFDPARITKKLKNPTFFRSVLIQKCEQSNRSHERNMCVTIGSKIILRTIENVPIRTDPLQTFRIRYKPLVLFQPLSYFQLKNYFEAYAFHKRCFDFLWNSIV